jgi:O-antigen ligase
MDSNVNMPRIGGLNSAAVGASANATAPAKPSPPRNRQVSATQSAYISIMLFMVVYCARPEDWIPGLGAIHVAKIVASLALIAFLLCVGQVRQRFPKEVICLLLLIVQLFCTVPFSPVWMGGAFMNALDFAKVGFIILVMAISANSYKRLRQLIYIQAASVAIISVITVWKGRIRSGRLTGVLNGNYTNSNDLALAIVISLPLCVAMLFLSKRVIWKIFWGLALVVMAYAILLTGSRAGFLALAISGVMCFWEVAVRQRRFYLLPIAGIACAILIVLTSGTIVQRLKSTFSMDADDTTSAYGSAQAREHLLWRSLQVTAHYPIFGVGPGNFAQISGSWHETHNSYTQMSAEAGIPALILYLIILSCGFKNLRQAKRLIRNQKELRMLQVTLHASLTGFAIGSFFASVAFQFFPYFVVSYTTALLKIAKQYSQEQAAKAPPVQAPAAENGLPLLAAR